MLFHPADEPMWDPSVLWHEGRYYLFAMNNAGKNNMLMATSEDGAHWTDLGHVFAEDAPFKVWKMFVARCGDRFTLNHGSFSERPGHSNDTLCFWESRDLVHWEYLGKAFDRTPDPRWYKEVGRCDHMYMFPKEEGRPAAGYWGYVTATSAPAWPHKAIGMMESEDGRDWKWLPPPRFEWGDTPQQFMECGGVERIGERYYMLLGARYNYMGNSGYSMFTFVSEAPTGPFRPDLPAFRLLGNSEDLERLGYGGVVGSFGVNGLVSFDRGEGGELLLTHTIHSQSAEAEVWFASMKKAVVDGARHLRMGWWPGNEILKGRGVAVDFNRCERLIPAREDDEHRVDKCRDGVRLKDRKVQFRRGGGGGVLVMMENQFDLSRGFIMEGRMTVVDEGWGADTHIIPVAAGFFFEEEAGVGLGLLMETYGITRIDRVDFRGGALSFARRDITGPGCAPVKGLPVGRAVPFRLLARHDMIELYLDDLLAQTFVIAPNATGRVGFLVQDGGCNFDEVKVWAMSFDDAGVGSE